MLIGSGFSLFDNNLKSILYRAGGTVLPISYQNNVYGDAYYNMRLWARTRLASGRLPLFYTAEKSLEWECVRHVFNANMPAIQELDVITGLPVFMLTAIGTSSNLESIYNLLREYPVMVIL